MKQNLLNKLWLRVGMIVAIMTTALSGTAWAGVVTYKLTIDYSNFNASSYAANNNEKTSNAVCTTDETKTYEVKWTSNQVMLSAGKMQWQKNKGYIYNSTDLGTITNVTINKYGDGTFTTYYGTSTQPSSSTTVGGGYFQTKVGSSAIGYTYSIEITFQIEEGGTPLADSDLALTGSTSLSFDLYNNSAAKTISFTSSSTGAVTVSESDYVETSVSGNTITVTPVKVTPSAQTITVNQAADGTYKAGSATFTVNITDSTPFSGSIFIFNTDAGLTELGITKPGSSAGTDLATNHDYTIGIVTMNVTHGSTNTRVWAGSNGATDLRVYNGGSLTFTVPAGYAITKVTFAGSTIGLNNQTDGVWTASGDPVNTVTFTNGNTGSKINTITVEYEADTTPIITASTNEIAYDAISGSITYSVTNPVEGGVVTATSSENWLTVGTPSNGTIALTCAANSETTVRTATVTLTYTYNTNETVTTTVTVTQAAAPVIYTTIPALFDAATSTSTPVTVTFGNWVVTGVNGGQVFVTDGTNGFIIYQSGHGFEVGNTLSGTASCNLVLYNGYAELTDLTSATEGLTVGTNGSVTPVATTIDALRAVNTGSVVTLSNLTCSVSTSGNYINYDLSDGTNTIRAFSSIYDFTANSDLEDGNTYSVTGIFCYNTSIVRIYPRSDADIEEYVAPTHTATFFVNGVEQTDDEVEVSEGATITFPATPADIDGKTFVGWTTTQITGTTDTAPTMVTSATMGTADVTYYAVFANQEGEGTTTGTLTEAEIMANFSNAAMAYNDAAKTFADTGDDITWEVKGYATKDAPWIQLRKNNVVAYMKITAPSNITNLQFTVSNTTNVTGTSTSVLTNHGAFAGSLILLSEPTANSTEGTLGSTNEVNDYIANITPTSSAQELYVQVTAAARIWGVEVTYGSATYSGYCTTIPVAPTSQAVTVSAAGYATFVAEHNLEIPADVEVFAVTVNDGAASAHLNPITDGIPSGEAVLVRANAGTYEFPYTAETVAEITNNDLEASDGTITGGENIYALANKTSNGIGFYPVATTVTIPENKAYLDLSAVGGVKAFYGFEEDDPTGIDNLNANVNANETIYNLSGQMVNGKLPKGIYIVNGKKILK